MSETTPSGPGTPATRRILFAALAAGLAAIVIAAAMREARVQAPPAAAPAPGTGMGENHARAPMSADEERFAHALWQVHGRIRTEAVRMSFTGLAYKTGEIQKEAVRDRIAPLRKVFEDAAGEVKALPGPASLEATRNTYLDALRLYRDASAEMIQVARDGSDAHLIAAQEKTSRAASLLLEVSEKLWPGEYKPN